MANETVTKSSRFYCVSLTPDICKTPIGSSTPPIPYIIIGEFVDTVQASPNVKAHSQPVYLHGKSYIPAVKGDLQGSAGGIKSGTVGARAESKAGSSTFRANLAATFQTGRLVWMNARNTVGAAYERSAQDARARLQAYAREYKTHISQPLHDFSADVVAAGGAVSIGGGVLAVGGTVATATGVGAVVGAPTMSLGAAVGLVGRGVATVGGFADGMATILDKAADYVLTGKTLDMQPLLAELARSVAQDLAFNKISVVAGIVPRFVRRALPGAQRGQKPLASGAARRSTGKNPNDGRDGGKVRKPAVISDRPVERLSYRPTSGVELSGRPGETTTILGSYAMDMKNVVAELGNKKSIDFGPKPGRFNVLNVPDDLYKSPTQFWKEYNQPWLQAAIRRNDRVLMATKPGFEIFSSGSATSVLVRANPITGKFELSGFGREYLQLRRAGYIYANGAMNKK